MAFMVYVKQGSELLQTSEYFSLAGYNLIYQLWEKRGKPTDQGWHITADDLIKEYTEGSGSIETHAFLIDFHPSSRTRIGLIELLDIYAYTYSGETEKDADWTPMMLRLRDVLYEEYENEISDAEKEAKIKKLKNPKKKKTSSNSFILMGLTKDGTGGGAV